MKMVFWRQISQNARYSSQRNPQKDIHTSQYSAFVLSPCTNLHPEPQTEAHTKDNTLVHPPDTMLGSHGANVRLAPNWRTKVNPDNNGEAVKNQQASDKTQSISID